MFVCDDQANLMKFGPRFFEQEKKYTQSWVQRKNIRHFKGKYMAQFVRPFIYIYIVITLIIPI